MEIFHCRLRYLSERPLPNDLHNVNLVLWDFPALCNWNQRHVIDHIWRSWGTYHPTISSNGFILKKEYNKPLTRICVIINGSRSYRVFIGYLGVINFWCHRICKCMDSTPLRSLCISCQFVLFFRFAMPRSCNQYKRLETVTYLVYNWTVYKLDLSLFEPSLIMEIWAKILF